MSDQLNLFDRRAPAPEPAEDATPSIDERWNAFAARNPHVLEGALQIARAWLDRGDEYISAKAIMENLRIAKHKVTGDGGYKLNNDFTAPMARWLVQNEPRLEGVIRFRERRTK